MAGLRAADEVMAAHTAAGKPIKAVARAAGVSERTVYRRRATPAFRRRVLELRRELNAELLRNLAEHQGES